MRREMVGSVGRDVVVEWLCCHVEYRVLRVHVEGFVSCCSTDISDTEGI